MNNEKNTILFTLVYKDQEYPMQTNANQYYSLMALISGHLAIPGFGLCSGMGSCGTCLVDICDRHSAVGRSTLSCDVQVNDQLANTVISISPAIY